MSKHTCEAVIYSRQCRPFWWLWESTQEPEQNRKRKNNAADTLQKIFARSNKPIPTLLNQGTDNSAALAVKRVETYLLEKFH